MTKEILKHDATFWERLDSLLKNNKVVIDRPKDSHHPKYQEVVYPIDYGYLEGTNGGDGNDIDVWVGSQKEKTLDAIVCTVDMLKKDTEIKLLLGCTDHEKKIIINFHNNKYMSGILLKKI